MTVRRWATVCVVAAWIGVGVASALGLNGDHHIFSIALVGAALITIGRITMPYRETVRAVYALGRADERRSQRERVPVR
jgi:hypothetical protein